MRKMKACPGCGSGFLGGGKYCSDKCSTRAVNNAIEQLKEKKGAIYDKWKERLKESLERI